MHVNWPDKFEPMYSGEQEPEPADGYELIEGMDVYDVGFHRCAIDTLYPAHWQSTGNLPDMWYTRPPDVWCDH